MIELQGMASTFTRGDPSWIVGKMSSPKSGQVLELAAQVGGVGSSLSLEVFKESLYVVLRD